MRLSFLSALIFTFSPGEARAWPWDAPAAELVYEVEATGKPSIDAALAARAADVLRKRLTSFAFEGTVEPRDGGRIVVSLRSRADDPEAVLKPLLKPAKLEFRIAGLGEKPSADETVFPEAHFDPQTLEVTITKRPVKKKVLLSGAAIATANATMDNGFPGVGVEFTADGAAKFAQVTRENVGRALAVVVDGKILSVATIHSAIEGGRLSLTGGLTQDEARDTARLLASGALPARIKLVKKIVGGQNVAIEQAPAAPAPARPGPAPAPAPAPVVVSDVDEPPPSLGRSRADAYAVVVGVERTRQGLARADFAARDAQVFADYLIKTLGYPEQNVALLLDEHAAKSDLEKYFEDWLPKKLARGGTAVVFFSGHGAPDAARGKAYLVPYDGDPAYLEKTSYPMTRLTDGLAALINVKAIVLADACFSGAGKRSALAKGARPLVVRAEPKAPLGPVAVLSAAASNQIGGSYDEKGHGLFTYFLLSALRDAARAGRSPTVTELHRDLAGKVEAAARRLSGNEQTPLLQAAGEAAQNAL